MHIRRDTLLQNGEQIRKYNDFKSVASLDKTVDSLEELVP